MYILVYKNEIRGRKKKSRPPGKHFLGQPGRQETLFYLRMALGCCLNYGFYGTQLIQSVFPTDPASGATVVTVHGQNGLDQMSNLLTAMSVPSASGATPEGLPTIVHVRELPHFRLHNRSVFEIKDRQQ